MNVLCTNPGPALLSCTEGRHGGACSGRAGAQQVHETPGKMPLIQSLVGRLKWHLLSAVEEAPGTTSA